MISGTGRNLVVVGLIALCFVVFLGCRKNTEVAPQTPPKATTDDTVMGKEVPKTPSVADVPPPSHRMPPPEAASLQTTIKTAGNDLDSAKTKEDRDRLWHRLLNAYVAYSKRLEDNGQFTEAMIVLDEGLKKEQASPFAGGEYSIVATSQGEFVDRLVHSGDGTGLMQVLRSPKVDWSVNESILSYLAEAVKKEYSATTP